MIVEILVVGAVIAYLTGWLARGYGRSVWWGLLGPVAAVLSLWAVGSAWIFSSFCEDVQTCDSGGWLAFTVTIPSLLLISLPGAVIGCLVARKTIK